MRPSFRQRLSKLHLADETKGTTNYWAILHHFSTPQAELTYPGHQRKDLPLRQLPITSVV